MMRRAMAMKIVQSNEAVAVTIPSEPNVGHTSLPLRVQVGPCQYTFSPTASIFRNSILCVYGVSRAGHVQVGFDYIILLHVERQNSGAKNF
eukprot:2564893-Amphidinium_carterae.3